MTADLENREKKKKKRKNKEHEKVLTKFFKSEENFLRWWWKEDMCSVLFWMDSGHQSVYAINLQKKKDKKKTKKFA